ncbi:MAG: GIY-YIG nuclease family protein [Halobacteriota archaeon]
MILWIESAKDVTVGKLGSISFASGFYAYIGSAMGAAGFKRVERHLDVSAGRNKTQKWHVDYLLKVCDVLETIEIATQERIECNIARNLRESPFLAYIAGFGSSDCRCQSHLFFSHRFTDVEEAMNRLVYSLYPGIFCALSEEDCARRKIVRKRYFTNILNGDRMLNGST